MDISWCVIFSSAVIGATRLTLDIDLAVRDGPLLSTLQQVIHPSLRRTHCDLADLVWVKQKSDLLTFLRELSKKHTWKSFNFFVEMFPETHKTLGGEFFFLPTG